MSGLLIGYARVSTDEQDLTAQRNALASFGVPAERIYVDHGLTGTHRDRPGLREALAACRAGDTLVVTKLDRLARSLPDARDIVDDLTRRQVKLNLGGSLHDPTDPVGRLLFNVLAMVAEFEADLIRARTREGMKVAKAKGRLRGKQPKLTPRQEAHLVAAAPYRRAHERRARRALQRRPLHRLPSARARPARCAGARRRVATLPLQLREPGEVSCARQQTPGSSPTPVAVSTSVTAQKTSRESEFATSANARGHAGRRGGHTSGKGHSRTCRHQAPPRLLVGPTLRECRPCHLDRLAQDRLGRVAVARDDLLVDPDSFLGATERPEPEALVDQRLGDLLAQRRLGRVAVARDDLLVTPTASSERPSAPSLKPLLTSAPATCSRSAGSVAAP